MDDSKEIKTKTDTAQTIIELEIPKTKYRGVRRNKPCPCGSGLKFKKCCIRN